MTLLRIRLACAALASIFFLAPAAAPAQQNGLAVHPPMGWNSWNHFHGKIDDATIRAQAEAMVSSGMRDAGYTYINIDDTWQGTRDAQGIIHPNSRFPDMKALADFVHSKGLKLGIYSSPGILTCAKFAGSYGHEVQDAQTYAAWGIDYLKYDLCGLRDQMRAAPTPEAANKIMVDSYIKMRDALRSTGRPIVYSLCQYGVDAVWRWGTNVSGNLWRTTGDINDHYSRMAEIGFGQAGLSRFAGPGHWNDPDMLEVGNGGMTAEEYRTHMALWAILAAPLLAGNDLSTMTPETIAILTNRDVIAVDQDSAGKQGDRVDAEGPIEIWAKPLADGSKAVGVFNRAPSPLTTQVDFSKLGFGRAVKAKDLWLSKDLGTIQEPYTVTVPGHGVLFLHVSK
jgi:alpha-galactosidase